MVSTQDFAHEVWVSLENIRERLAVVETEIKHARRDLMRLETNLQSHVNRHPAGGSADNEAANAANSADAAVNVRVSRKVLSGSAAVGKALGWW